jgi:glucose/mannose-6-phosphate isomerase
VAYRWKTQLNENGKSFAAVETLPEATHNAVVGYEHPDVLHDHLYMVFLASSSDHPRNSLRATLSSELLTAVGVSYQVVPVGGEGHLAQACAAILLGDYVSTYVALLYGVDPMPVEAIAHVKHRLMAREGNGSDLIER